MDCFSTIVGTSFRDSEAKRAVNERISLGETHFELEREPTNEYDPLAIKVIFLEPDDGRQNFIGYLARGNNAAIAHALDDGAEPSVTVIDFEGRKPVVKVSW